jgi:autotransporter-associated beta strand protein
LALSGTNTYSGGTTLIAGTLGISSDAALGASGGAVAFAGTSVLQWNAPFALNASRNISLAQDITPTLRTPEGSDGTVAGVISGGGSASHASTLTKDGPGKLTLTGTNTFTCLTAIAAGTLSVDRWQNLGATVGTLTFGSGTLEITGTTPFTYNKPTTITTSATVNVVESSQSFTLGGAVSGGGSLSKSGAGDLTLNGSNSCTGGTTINAGMFHMGASGALPANGNVTVVAGATLDLATFSATIGELSGNGTVDKRSGASTVTLTVGSGSFAGQILNTTGTVTLAKTGAGTLTLSGSNSYGGGTSISGGVLNVNSDAALGASGGSVAFAGSGTLQWNGSFDLNSSRNISISSGAATFDTQGGNATVLGVISGNGSLTKAGSGSLALNVANSYSGGTTVNAGATLRLGATGALPSGKNLVLNGMLDLLTSNATVGTLSGSGAIDKSAAGSSTLTVSSGTFSGQIRNTAGTVALTKTGMGTLTLAPPAGSANAYSGATTVSSGTVWLDNSGALPSGNNVTLSTTIATLKLAACSAVIGTLSGSGYIDNASGSSSVAVTSGSFSGQLRNPQGTLSLTKTGEGATLTLSGVSSYTGGTTVNAGTLALSGVNRLSTAGAITITGGVLDLGNNSQTTSGAVSFQGGSVQNGTITKSGADFDGRAGTVTAVLAGTAGLTKSGSGTLTLSAANTYPGATTIGAGILALSGGSNRLAGGGGITMTGGVLDLGGFSQSVSGGVSFQGGTVQNGTITKSGAAYDGQAGTVSAVLAGAVGLTKTEAATLLLSGSNTYTGATTISAGTLAVVDLANGGLPSNIGQSSAAAANLVLDGGTLSYTGAGDSTDRLFTLGPGGGTLDASSGALTFSNDTGEIDVSGSGARGLTLTGAFTGNSTFAPSLPDSEYGVVSLVKQGQGTWCLAAANAYTGGTTIQDGALSVTAGDNLGQGAAGLTFDGGTLEINGNSFSYAQPVTVLSSGTVDVPDTDDTATFSGEGSGLNYVKTGDGTEIIDGVIAYDSATIEGGTVVIGDHAGFGNPSASLTVGDGATLDLNGHDICVGSLSGSSGGTITSRMASWPASITVNQMTGTDTVFAGVIEDGEGVQGAQVRLNKWGGGKLELSGNNTYSGGTEIEGGTLSISAASNLGTGWVLFTSDGILKVTGSQPVDITNSMFIKVGATLEVTNNNATGVSINGAIENYDGEGGLTKTGNGTLTLTHINSYAGATTIQEGGLSVSADSQLGTGGITFAGGALKITGDQVFESAKGVTLAADATIEVTNTHPDGASFTGVIEGEGALAKCGGGKLTLGGQNNTYTGGTTINGGTLTISADAALGAVPGSPVTNVTFAGSGTLQFGNQFDLGDTRNISIASGVTATFDTQAYGVSILGSIGDAGALNKSGTGTLTLGNAGNGYTGGTTVGQGVLAQGANGGLPNNGDVTVESGMVLDLAGHDATIRGLWGGGAIDNLSGASVNTLSIQCGYFVGPIADSYGTLILVKTGAGTLQLSESDNAYSGATVLNGGTLCIDHDLALGAAGGNLAFTADATLQWVGSFNLDPARALTISSGATATIDTQGNDVAIAGVIGGSGGLTKIGAGGLTLSGTNTYTGGTTLVAGTLNAGSSSPLGASGGYSGGGLNLVGGTFDVSGNALTLYSLYGSAGTITNNGTGTALTVLSGSFSGAINDGDGSLSLMKSGDGILSLSGPNTYSAGTYVTGGSLALGGSNSHAYSLTIASGTLSTSGGALASSVSLAMYGGSLHLTGDLSLDSLVASSGSPTIEGSGTLTASGFFHGTISGVDLAVPDGGTLTLTGSDNANSNTVDSGGLLQLGDSSSRNCEVTGDIINNGTLVFANPSPQWYGSSGVISGTGTVCKSGSGTLTLYGTNPYTGPTEVGAGTLVVAGSTSNSPVITNGGVLQAGADDLSLYSLTMSGGVFDINGHNVTILGLSGSGGIGNSGGGSHRLTVNQATDTNFSGTIYDGNGSVALTKSGAGILTLSGTNAFTAETRIEDGTLQIGIDGALSGGVSPLTVLAGGTLDLNNHAITTGRLSGDGIITNTAIGTGTLVVSETADTAFSGTIQDGGDEKVTALTKCGRGSAAAAKSVSPRGPPWTCTARTRRSLGSTATAP